jgi:VanZ family protein
MHAGVVVSDHPLKAGDSDANEPCSLELLLRSTGMQFKKTILSFYARNNPRQFQLVQVGNVLWISHEFVDASGKPKILQLGLNETLAQGQLALITITSGPHGTVTYKNGKKVDSFSRVRISPTDLSGQIVLGTSPVDYDPWEGEVHGLALYAKELTSEEALHHYINWTGASEAEPPDVNGALALYDFGEGKGRSIHNAIIGGPDLQIPRIFRVPYKPLLESPLKELEMTGRYVRSVLLNIALFVPLGCLFCAYWMLTQGSRQAVLRAILGAGLLSLIIEVLQAYIPIRFSGMTDIVTNTLGASLGAILAKRANLHAGLVRLRVKSL